MLSATYREDFFGQNIAVFSCCLIFPFCVSSHYLPLCSSAIESVFLDETEIKRGRAHFMWIVHLTITNINVTAAAEGNNANSRRTGPIFKICCETGYSLKNKDNRRPSHIPLALKSFIHIFSLLKMMQALLLNTKYFDAVTLPDQPNLLPRSFFLQKALQTEIFSLVFFFFLLGATS